MIGHACADHLHSANQVVFDAKHFSDMNAGGAAGKAAHIRSLAIRQFDLTDGAIHVEHAIGPHDTALLVYKRESEVVNVVHDAEVTTLELLLTIRPHVVEAGSGLLRTRRIGGVRAVLDTVAVIGKGIKTLAVVLLHSFEVCICDGDELLA